MHALLIVLALLGGFAVPSSLGAITTLQWISIGLSVAGDAKNLKNLPREAQQLRAFLESPAFRQMLATNGEAAIKWQDRQMEN